MKKTSLKKLIIAAGAVALAGGAVAGLTLGLNKVEKTSNTNFVETGSSNQQLINKENSNKFELDEPQVDVETPDSSESVETPEASVPEVDETKPVEPSKPESSKTTYSLITKMSSKFDEIGSIEILDGKTTAQAGDTITVKATILNSDFTLTDLKVFCEGQHSLMLGVTKNGDNYTFTMPNEKDSYGRPNGFYNGSTNIIIRAKFGKAKINAYEFDWATKSYVYNVTEDNWVFDDIANPGLVMENASQTFEMNEDDIPGDSLVHYRLYLNNHNIVVKNITVEKGTQFWFTNNAQETYTPGNKPQVAIADKTGMYYPETEEYGRFKIDGAIALGISCQSVGRMESYLPNGPSFNWWF